MKSVQSAVSLFLSSFCILHSAFLCPAVTFTNNARIEITDSTGSLSRSAANGDLTVMCWFKFSIPSGVTINNDMAILVNQSGSTTTNNTHAYNVYFNPVSGSVDFTAKGVGGLYRQTLIAKPFIDRWYHVAVAMSGANYYPYDVDGQAVATSGEGASGNTSVTNSVSIGGWGSGKYLWGEVQEAAIYQAKLIGTQIAARMFQDQSTNANIRGYYKFGASTNSADWLNNFAVGGVAGAGNAIPSVDALAFEETDQAGEQSLYDSRKNRGMDSIAPLSGALSWSQTAFARPTPGIAFDFEYAYSSAIPQSGGSGDVFDLRTLGAGWRHSFDIRLVRGESSTVLNLLTWDGASEVWDRSPTNTLIYRTRHKEYRGELTKLNDGTDCYEWVTPERLIYHFTNVESGNSLMDGRLLDIRDYNSNRVQLIWNEGEGRIAQISDSAGGQYSFNYNPAQLLTNVSFGSWRVRFDYDSNNVRLVSKSITNTSGLYTNANTTWQFQYNTNGLLACVLDPRGNTNVFVQYDQYGRQTNEVDALSRATATRYGVPGKRQITHIDPAGFQWIESYDRKGRILTNQDPLLYITSYTYDTNGNRTSITEPLGYKTLFGYDTRANVIARTNELNQVTRWAFHGFFNKATNEVNALGWTNHYVLDNNTGNLLRHYDALGTLVSYTYKTNGLVETSSDANGNVTRFAYDTNGFMVAQTDPATNTTSFTLNDVGWKLAQTNPLGQVTTFAYDLNGNVVRTVDPLQRVSTRTYDANGNLLSASDAKGQLTRFYYDVANQRTQTVDRASNSSFLFYTTRGKLDRATDPLLNTVTNFYDNANRVTSIDWDCGLTAKDITNRYDALGRRISRKVDNAETRFVLDLSSSMERILCDTTASGQITAWYVHGPDLCYKVDATNGLTCYHADAQANIIALTDGSTNTVAQYAYTPYGRTLGSSIQNPASGNQYTFVGSQGVMEELPGLYFMRARYYSAEAGVFLSTDPVKHIGPGWQPVAYMYAKANPMTFSDPGGLWWQPLPGFGLFKWHGNYGDPGWTGGHAVTYNTIDEWNTAEQEGKLPDPIDEEDRAYREHDYQYLLARTSGDKSIESRADLALAGKMLLLYALRSTPYAPDGLQAAEDAATSIAFLVQGQGKGWASLEGRKGPNDYESNGSGSSSDSGTSSSTSKTEPNTSNPDDNSIADKTIAAFNTATTLNRSQSKPAAATSSHSGSTSSSTSTSVSTSSQSSFSKTVQAVSTSVSKAANSVSQAVKTVASTAKQSITKAVTTIKSFVTKLFGGKKK